MKTTAACTLRGFVRGKRHAVEGMAETLERPGSDFEVNCGDRDTEQSGMYGLADAGLCEPYDGGERENRVREAAPWFPGFRRYDGNGAYPGADGRTEANPL